ncbi:MAG: PDZ domain-containing protein [Saprospirales bacterium]|nr:PDZ domain-containing protein [Saprospirales bacterium]
MKHLIVFPLFSLLLTLPLFANFTASAYPTQGFLGIQSNDLTEEKALLLGFDNPYGSYVSTNIPNTAAEKAGLQAFDYIYQINDQAVDESTDLVDLLSEYNAGDEVTVHFFRKGKRQQIQVTLGERPIKWAEAPVLPNEKPFLGISEIGMDGDEDIIGVAVAISSRSAAAEMGLKNGDVVTAINGFPMLDWADITTAISNGRPGEVIEVTYIRNGEKAQAEGTLKSLAETKTPAPKIAEAPPAPLQDENKVFMGIYAEMISEEKAMKMGLENNFGTLVTGIVPNSGAEKAGLQLFDYLYGIDAYRAGEGQHFGIILMKYNVGDKAKLYFIRKGEAKTADITFGKRPDMPEKKEMTKCEDTFLGIASTDETKSGEIDGIKINPVKNSTALAIGMQDGDVIKTLNGYRMYDWDDISYVLDNLKPGDPITVGYERNGKLIKGSGKIKSYAETKNCKNCDCSDLEDMDFNINIDIPEIKFDLPGIPKAPRAPEPAPRPDISNMTTEVQDLSADEARKLNEKFSWSLQTGTLAVQSLKLTPNPSEGSFGLRFDLPTRGNTVVRVFNPLGRLIYDYDLGSFSGAFNDQVDISQNGPGTYYLEIKQGDKVTAKKIVLTGK